MVLFSFLGRKSKGHIKRKGFQAFKGTKAKSYIHTMGGKRHSEEMKAAIVTYWQNNHQNPDWQWQKVAETFSVPKTTVSLFKI